MIYSRAPVHAQALVERLNAGDVETARLIGLPPGLVGGRPSEAVTPVIQLLARPLFERAALVSALDEAWAMLAG